MSAVLRPLPWEYDDGGRAAAGFRGEAGDCVTRAIAIAAGLDYRLVYDRLAGLMADRGGRRSARNGIGPKVYKPLLAELGLEWTATMGFGTGCTVHLAVGEVPAEGRYVVNLSLHLAAVVDGVVRDTYDPGRGGTRCVYGHWRVPDLGVLPPPPVTR